MTPELTYFPMTGMPLTARTEYGPGALMILSPRDDDTQGPATAAAFAVATGMVLSTEGASTRTTPWRAWLEGDGQVRLGASGFMVLDDLPVTPGWELIARGTTTVVLYLSPTPVRTRPQAAATLRAHDCWWTAVPVLPGIRPTDGTWPTV